MKLFRNERRKSLFSNEWQDLEIYQFLSFHVEGAVRAYGLFHMNIIITEWSQGVSPVFYVQVMRMDVHCQCICFMEKLLRIWQRLDNLAASQR